MKKRKRIMCSGLAFGDKEDMEMLHKYALEGWISGSLKAFTIFSIKKNLKTLSLAMNSAN